MGLSGKDLGRSETGHESRRFDPRAGLPGGIQQARTPQVGAVLRAYVTRNGGPGVLPTMAGALRRRARDRAQRWPGCHRVAAGIAQALLVLALGCPSSSAAFREGDGDDAGAVGPPDAGLDGGPTVGDVLDRLGEVTNAQNADRCACLVADGAGPFRTEEECLGALSAGGPSNAAFRECFRAAVATIEEPAARAELVVVIACSADATDDGNVCWNDVPCSNSAARQACAMASSAASDACLDEAPTVFFVILERCLGL